MLFLTWLFGVVVVEFLLLFSYTLSFTCLYYRFVIMFSWCKRGFYVLMLVSCLLNLIVDPKFIPFFSFCSLGKKLLLTCSKRKMCM